MTPQRVTMLTLAVRDLEKSRSFYKDLGFEESDGGNEIIAFYKLGNAFLSLYSKDALTKDLCMPIHGRPTGTVTMSTNYTSKAEVDAAFAKAIECGATPICDPKEVFWGGYSGNYADPDGHLWEVAFNPFWEMDKNGQVVGDP